MAIEAKDKIVNLEDLKASHDAIKKHADETYFKNSDKNTKADTTYVNNIEEKLNAKTQNIVSADGVSTTGKDAWNVFHGTATKAEQDGDGNVITDTYFKLADKNTKADTSYVNQIENTVNLKTKYLVSHGRTEEDGTTAKYDSFEGTAARANMDYNGNSIIKTYATKSELNDVNTKTQNIVSADGVSTTGKDAWNVFHGTATKAEQDGDGNVITETYFKNSDKDTKADTSYVNQIDLRTKYLKSYGNTEEDGTTAKYDTFEGTAARANMDYNGNSIINTYATKNDPTKDFGLLKRKCYAIKNHDGTDDGTNEAFDTWNGRAMQDGNGNVIASTYATKDDVASTYVTKENIVSYFVPTSYQTANISNMNITFAKLGKIVIMSGTITFNSITSNRNPDFMCVNTSMQFDSNFAPANMSEDSLIAIGITKGVHKSIDIKESSPPTTNTLFAHFGTTSTGGAVNMIKSIYGNNLEAGKEYYVHATWLTK